MRMPPGGRWGSPRPTSRAVRSRNQRGLARARCLQRRSKRRPQRDKAPTKASAQPGHAPSAPCLGRACALQGVHHPWPSREPQSQPEGRQRRCNRSVPLPNSTAALSSRAKGAPSCAALWSCARGAQPRNGPRNPTRIRKRSGSSRAVLRRKAGSGAAPTTWTANPSDGPDRSPRRSARRVPGSQRSMRHSMTATWRGSGGRRGAIASTPRPSKPDGSTAPQRRQGSERWGTTTASPTRSTRGSRSSRASIKAGIRAAAVASCLSRRPQAIAGWRAARRSRVRGGSTTAAPPKRPPGRAGCPSGSTATTA
jgi:hypothetical protein